MLNHVVTVLEVLAGWCLIAVVSGLLIGCILRGYARDQERDNVRTR